MKIKNSLATIAFLCLIVLGDSRAQAAPSSPLKVTLTATPCPIGLTQGPVTLKAQITGGYQPGIRHLLVVTRYTFYAPASTGGGNTILKENTPDPTVAWIPNLPGSHVVSVTVKQSAGSEVVQATAQAQCEVKKVAYQVTLNISPPSGQAEAPPPTDAKKMIVSASVSPALPNATNTFSFVVQKMNSGVVAQHTDRVNRSNQSWPASPAQPADPGMYRIAVQVVGYLTFPSGDVVVAEGQKEVNYYEAKPVRTFSNVVTHPADTSSPTARLEVGGYGILEGLQEILITSPKADIEANAFFSSVCYPYGGKRGLFAEGNVLVAACRISAQNVCERLVFAKNTHRVGIWNGTNCRLSITGSPVSVGYDNTKLTKVYPTGSVTLTDGVVPFTFMAAIGAPGSGILQYTITFSASIPWIYEGPKNDPPNGIFNTNLVSGTLSATQTGTATINTAGPNTTATVTLTTH